MTVQDTQGVHAVEADAAGIVRGQIEAALGDIGADAIKIGMLGNAAIAAAVADALAETRHSRWCSIRCWFPPAARRCWIDAGIEILKRRLLPRAMLVTPNLPESEVLVGIRPEDDHAIRQAAQAFALLGARACAVQGRPWRRRDGARCADRASTGTRPSFRIAAPGHPPYAWHGLHAFDRHCLRLAQETWCDAVRRRANAERIAARAGAGQAANPQLSLGRARLWARGADGASSCPDRQRVNAWVIGVRSERDPAP